MGTRGRKSAASLSVIPGRVDGNPDRLRPPPELGPRERELWLVVVGSVDPKHFVASDGPLLQRYVEAAVQAELAAEHLRQEGAVVAGRLNPWALAHEKASRSCAALATRLRLSPSSRYDARAASRTAYAPASAYDLMGLGDE